MNSDSLLRVGYIISPSYSGSTLLSCMLSPHPQIATVGELTGIAESTIKKGEAEHYQCSCGDELKSCSFWNAVADNLKQQSLDLGYPRFNTNLKYCKQKHLNAVLSYRTLGFNFIEQFRDQLLFHIPSTNHITRMFEQVNEAAMNAIVEIKKAKVFMDASKNPVRYQRLTKIKNINLLPILLTRDGRGTSLSFTKNKGIPFEIATRYWIRTQQEIQRIIRMTSRPYLHVKYEELCSHPAGEMNRISNYMDVKELGWDGKYDKESNHIIGNRMRLIFNGTVRSDEKWRHELSTAQLKQFDRMAGSTNKFYGYDQ